MSNVKFDTAFDAGYDAGMYGANNFNSHYSWFRNQESMKEWQRGNDAGSSKREAERHEETKQRMKELKRYK